MVFLSISAFTLSHSLSLSLSVLGLLRLRSAPVEAAIALSLLLLAIELAQGARSGAPAFAVGSDPTEISTSTRGASPPTLAFAFGLLHGLGFAGALLDLGLPARRLPLSLLSFNLGVELGQVAFLAVVLLFLAVLVRTSRWLESSSRPRSRSLGGALLSTDHAGAYLIGVPAAFLLITRMAGLIR